jgi:hypothetical protein
MNAGITLAKWFKHEARRVYAMLDESEADRDQRRLAEWIGRRGGAVTPRDVQQGCRWLKEPGVAEAALEGLVKAGRGTWRDVPTTAEGGRPARAFVLSTPSTDYGTPTKPEKTRGFVDVDGVDTPEEESKASAGQNAEHGDKGDTQRASATNRKPAGDGQNAFFENQATSGPYGDRF